MVPLGPARDRRTIRPSSCHSMAQNVTSIGVPQDPAISPPNVGTEVTVESGSVASTSGHVKRPVMS